MKTEEMVEIVQGGMQWSNESANSTSLDTVSEKGVLSHSFFTLFVLI